jgi:hypothetical protein
MNYKQIALRQDKRIAKKSGFKIQSNSGAPSGRKGDLYGPDILIETKTAEVPRGSFSIKLSWLDKVREQAFGMGKLMWALFFSFGDNDDYVVVDSSTFYALYKAHQELEELLREN